MGLEPFEPFALGLLFLGLAVLAAVAALSHQRERAFSAALIYLALGALAAVVIEVLGLPWLDPITDAEALLRITELAMVAALFAAGLKLDRALSWREWSSVVRLIVLALPLTVAGVALLGQLALGLGLAGAILLGAAASPTDPVLAGDIGVGPPGDEVEHEPNFALTAEAGINDALAFPFILLGVLVAERASAAEWLLADVLWAVAGAAAIGALMGRGLAASVVRLRERRLLARSLDGWFAVAVPLLIYGAAQTLDTYGFLAVFAGGLAFRRYERDHELNARVHHGAEVVEKFGELAVILLLGSMLSVSGLGAPGPGGWLVAAALILLVRPLVTRLALLRSAMNHRRERAFVSWFGVRGVGTAYYAATIVTTGTLSTGEEQVVVWTLLVCVLASVFVHGITAGPALRRLRGPQQG